MTGVLGYDEAAAVYVPAPKGFAILLATETIVSIALIFIGFHFVGWIFGGVAASVTAVSYRAHERSVRKRAGTKYVPSRTISRLVAALLLVSIAAGTIHAFSIGSERKLKPVGQDQS